MRNGGIADISCGEHPREFTIILEFVKQQETLSEQIKNYSHLNNSPT